MKIILLFYIIFLNTVTKAEDKLVLTHIFHRHGDRSPIRLYPTSPYSLHQWPDGLGQLTNKGKREIYELGTMLRRKYMETYGLLNHTYIPKQTYMRSTDLGRTLMSAELVLEALFPPSQNQVWLEGLNWQPTPVHTKPDNKDYLLNMKVECKAFNKQYEELMESFQEEKIFPIYKKLLEYVKKEAGMDELDLSNLFIVYDSLYCFRAFNLSMPAWTQTIFPLINDSGEKESKTVEEWINQLYSIAVTVKYGTGKAPYYKTGFMLRKVLQDTDNCLFHNNTDGIEEGIYEEFNFQDTKAFIYSTHDTMLASLLSAMRVFNGIVPPYASCVMIDVFKDTSDEYYIMISYRNDTNQPPYILTPPDCKEKCNLRKFKEIVKDNIPEKSWEEECFDLQNKTIAIFVFLVFVVLLILVILAILVCKKQKKSYQQF